MLVLLVAEEVESVVRYVSSMHCTIGTTSSIRARRACSEKEKLARREAKGNICMACVATRVRRLQDSAKQTQKRYLYKVIRSVDSPLW